jgi:hypothetical protein
MFHQIDEEFEFSGEQFDAVASSRDGAVQEIDLQVGQPQPGFHRRSRLAAAKRGDSRQQFCEGKRLDEIVVGAAFKPMTRSSTRPMS